MKYEEEEEKKKERNLKKTDLNKFRSLFIFSLKHYINNIKILLYMKSGGSSV